TKREWQQSFARCLGLLLSGNAIEDYDERGRPIEDDTMIMLLNAHHENIDFSLPSEPQHARWQVLIDTSFNTGKRDDNRFFHSNEKYPLQARSVVLLVRLVTPLPYQSKARK
ncbi:MAG: glycogen debranching enzyme GlgX, partial [Gammaproteobacteria bacterium]|nr:glycogen debranching enzyme GlgX [Gammaproteobacteria bacterium]